MPRPRKEEVRYIKLRLPQEAKIGAERMSVRAFQSLTSWVLQSITMALNEPVELFRINFPAEPIDGSGGNLFLEVPAPIIERLGKMIGSTRPVDIGNTIARIIAMRASGLVAC